MIGDRFFVGRENKMVIRGDVDILFWITLGAVSILFIQFYKKLHHLKGGNHVMRKNDLHKVPGPAVLPFMGTVWIYFIRYKTNKIHEAYQDMIKRYGSVVREVISGGVNVISISNKEDIEKVLRYPSKYPLRPPSKIIRDYRSLRPERFSSAGIANEQGELWHDLRNKLTSELTSKKTMLCFLPELNQIADDFMQLLRHNRNENNEILDFDGFSSKYALEASCTLVLGERMTFMENCVSETAKKLHNAMIQRFQSERDEMYSWGNYAKSSSYQKFLKCEEDLYSIVDDIVQNARSSKETIHTDVKCILMAIVERIDVDEREKRSALIDFVAAGILTLGNSLNFLMYLVAKHPEIQEKVYEELEEIAPNSNHITASDLSRMCYTKACMLEASRLIPVAFGITRVLAEDTVLGGYHLQAGTQVLCHTKIACSDEVNFTRAKEFLPERWLDGNPLQRETQVAASACVFAPFGAGKRMCPGKRFVEQGLLVTFAKLVREFQIEYDGELDVQFEFVLSPKTPVSFRLRDRC